MPIQSNFSQISSYVKSKKSQNICNEKRTAYPIILPKINLTYQSEKTISTQCNDYFYGFRFDADASKSGIGQKSITGLRKNHILSPSSFGFIYSIPFIFRVS